MAAESESELGDWIAAITKCIENAARRVCYYFFTQTCGAFCNSLKFLYRFLIILFTREYWKILNSTPFLFRLRTSHWASFRCPMRTFSAWTNILNCFKMYTSFQQLLFGKSRHWIHSWKAVLSVLYSMFSYPVLKKNGSKCDTQCHMCITSAVIWSMSTSQPFGWSTRYLMTSPNLLIRSTKLRSPDPPPPPH